MFETVVDDSWELLALRGALVDPADELDPLDWDEQPCSGELGPADYDEVSGFELAQLVHARASHPLDSPDARQLLERLAALDRVQGWLWAERTRVMASFALCRPPDPRALGEPDSGRRGAQPLGSGPAARVSEFAPDEIAAVLHASPRTACAWVGEALGLVEGLPATLRAVEAGSISPAVAGMIYRETHHLSAERRAEVERRVLARAAGRTYGQIRRHTRRSVLAVDPAGAVARAQEEVGYARGVRLRPAGDGLVAIDAVLGTEEGLLAFATLDAYAAANAGEGETDVPAGQAWRRADVLVDLLGALREQRLPEVLGVAPATGPAAQAVQAVEAVEGERGPLPPVIRVDVVVAASTLLGLDEQAAEVAGLGPIPADVARALARDEAAVLRRMLTAPGPAGMELVELSSPSYRPPPRLRAKVEARDRTCRFPGCARQVTGTRWGAELDHTIPWPLGTTTESNLEVLCTHHHRLKHEGGWRLVQLSRGHFEWTSPEGRTYRVEPELCVVDTTLDERPEPPASDPPVPIPF